MAADLHDNAAPDVWPQARQHPACVCLDQLHASKAAISILHCMHDCRTRCSKLLHNLLEEFKAQGTEPHSGHNGVLLKHMHGNRAAKIERNSHRYLHGTLASGQWECIFHALFWNCTWLM